MNLLLDENLSPRLVERLAALFPGLIHVRDVGLKQGSDEMIWDWAKRNGCTIVSTDSDFVVLVVERGWPPKVIHLEECDFPLRIIENLLRQNAVRITEFEKDPHAGLLAIRLAADRGPRRPRT